MPEEEKKKNSYISIIVTAVLIAGGIWLFVNKERFSDQKHYITFFKNVEGLTVSSQVSVNGAIIGKVSKTYILDSGIKVTIAIDPEVQLRKGTTAKLISAGMAGGREIKLTQGLSKQLLPEGGYITGIDGKNMMSKDGQIGSTIRVAKIALRTTDSILDDLSTLVDRAAIRDIRFQLNKIDKQSDDASKTAREARGTGENLAGTIHGINTDVAKLANDSKEWPKMIADAEKQSEGLVKSTAELEENMKSISASFKKLKPIFDKANDKGSSLGKLLEDKQSYNTATKQASEADKAAKEAMARPSAYWFAIFGSNR